MSSNTHSKSPAAAAASTTPQSSHPSGPGKHEQAEFHILPIDEDKKNRPPPKGRHSEGLRGGPDLKSEFHVGPAMMPGPFISSMGANSTVFEREQAQKSKKE